MELTRLGSKASICPTYKSFDVLFYLLMEICKALKIFLCNYRLKSYVFITGFCKQLVADGNYTDGELSDPDFSSDENITNDNPFTPGARHPFALNKDKPILMNIRVSSVYSCCCCHLREIS